MTMQFNRELSRGKLILAQKSEFKEPRTLEDYNNDMDSYPTIVLSLKGTLKNKNLTGDMVKMMLGESKNRESLRAYGADMVFAREHGWIEI